MNKRMPRASRVAAVLACMFVAGAFAGTAAGGGTPLWQDIWAQVKPLLAQSGTINHADNPVDWTKLKSVPTAFADGIDNGVDKAGFGLKKNLYPSLELAVDTTKIQQRVSGTCPEGQAIGSVAANGTVTCSAGAPVVHHGSAESNGSHIGDNWATVGGALDLPAGVWSFVALLNVSGLDFDFLACRLNVASDGVTQVRGEIKASAGGSAKLPVVLTGFAGSYKPLRAAVVCRDSIDGSGDRESNLRWSSIRITATQVSGVHSQLLD